MKPWLNYSSVSMGIVALLLGCGQSKSTSQTEEIAQMKSALQRLEKENVEMKSQMQKTRAETDNQPKRISGVFIENSTNVLSGTPWPFIWEQSFDFREDGTVIYKFDHK